MNDMNNSDNTSAIDILLGLAAATGAPGPRYVMAATHPQMTTLDEYGVAMGDHTPENVDVLVSTAIEINRMGKSVVASGRFILPHAAPAVQVLIDLLEAP